MKRERDNMPDNPNTWILLWGWLQNIPIAVQGFFMAALVAWLRVVYDEEETSRMRVALESLLCGLLTLCGYGVITWLGMPEGLAIAVGGAIGFIGVEKLREFANGYIDSFNRKKGGKK